MVSVHVPQSLRTLTDGEAVLSAEGHNLRAVIRDLAPRYPELAERLVNGDRIGRGLSLAINGDVVSTGLITRVPDDAEIAIVPQISGGSSSVLKTEVRSQHSNRCRKSVQIVLPADRADLSVAEEAGRGHRPEDLGQRRRVVVGFAEQASTAAVA